jgi:molecular chaperone HtpG
MDKQTQKYKFKAEIKQLLDILAHSLYTNREIFLRELISNASDALEKIRFEILQNTKVSEKDLPLEIIISLNKEKKLLTVSDSGIGMSEKEIITNIGTIAKSGTSDFIKRISRDKEDSANIIGKFGVGFYSVFIVAEEVVITSKSYIPGEKAVQWKSEGTGTFEIKKLTEKVSRGTKIEIHLKEDAIEFAEKWRIEEIVKKHSNFIPFPIKVDNEQINKVRAIWREPKFQIKQEEYDDFYKFLTYDSDPPLCTLHVSVDAPVQYNCLLFIPAKNYDKYMIGKFDHGPDLYIKRVLIKHEDKDLLPEYLRFLRGVVDSEDLPLNISRETLQENPAINKIKTNLVSQILSFLAKQAKDEPDKYKTFWSEFGNQFKMGYTDYTNKEKFENLLRFDSSSSEKQDDLTSFAEYISRLKDDQKEIYYIFAQNRENVTSSPHLEIFKKKGLEVLYLYEPVDEFVMSALHKYKDYELKAVEQADLDKISKFSDLEEQAKIEELSKEDEKVFSNLLRRMKDILGERVTDVKESKRLTDSPCCLVNPDGTMTSSMQRIMQIINKDISIPKKLMEINKNHPLIRNLISIYNKNSKDEYLTKVTEQLYESLLLLDGYLGDAYKMVNRIEDILELSTKWYMGKEQKEK